MKYQHQTPPKSFHAVMNSSNFLDSPSSTAVASRLYARSRRNSSSSEASELINMTRSHGSAVIDGVDLGSLATEMSSLSKRLSEIQEEKSMLNEERSRLKAENALLQERIHRLEDQYSNDEQRLEETLKSERERAKEMVQRMERESQLERENHLYKQQALERDLEAQRKEYEKLDSQHDDLQAKFAKQKRDADDANALIGVLEAEKKSLRQEFENYRKAAELDLEAHRAELEDLVKHNDELREMGLPNRSHRIGSIVEKMEDIEDRLHEKQLENKQLREQVEELKAQLLQESVQSGQLLLASGPSLAAELSGMDSDELMNALRDQELCNQHLRNYIDNILLRVMELYPEILDVGNANPSTSTKPNGAAAAQPLDD